MTQTSTTKEKSGFLMVKLDPGLKHEFKKLAVDEDIDMSKATRAAIIDWMAKVRRKHERRAAQNGS